MPDEDEEKMRKMRVRIERDAYSVLLSFKDGASPRQVEQRMDDTLGYTYNSKYHLAGVYDMSQILREHPQVRKTADGKFKIVANEDNEELVALISKQKDNKRKKGGNAGRGGRRPATSMGYHHHKNGFGQGLTMKSSPKVNNGMRPFSAMNRCNNSQKPMPSATNYSRPSTSNANPNFSVLRPKYGVSNNAANQSFTFGSSPKHYAAPAKSSAPINQFPGQRPLMRAPTASSIANCSLISLESTCSDATLVQSTVSSLQSYTPGHMPSIKEFTENAKYMMLRLHPESIHLSEMTDLYSQEYGVSVEPLQLFSKSWMNLVKTTFKEWLQMNEGVVSVKPDWFKKYGAAMKSALPPKQKPPKQSDVNPKLNRSVVIPEPNAVIPKANVSSQLDPYYPLNSKLPSSQGFRYQPPKLKPTGITAQTNAPRPVLRTPEKAKGVRKLTKTSPRLKKTPEQLVPPLQLFSRGTESSSLSQVPSEPVNRVLSVKPSTADVHYDARQLRSLKYVEKPKDLIDGVETALNGKADPQLNKIVKKKSKASWKPNTSFCSKFDSILHVNAIPNCESDQMRSTPPKDRNAKGTLNNGVRIFGQALNAVLKQNGPETKVPQQTLYTVPSIATPVPCQKNEITSTEEAESDDGWGIPSVPSKPGVAPTLPTASRPILLPPMSKGSLRNKDRSRPTSICNAISSQDGVWLEKALHATLPDDEDW